MKHLFLPLGVVLLLFAGADIGYSSPTDVSSSAQVVSFYKKLESSGQCVIYEIDRATLIQSRSFGLILMPRIPLSKVAVQNYHIDNENYLLPRVQTTVYSGMDANLDGKIEKTHGSYESREALALQPTAQIYKEQIRQYHTWAETEMQHLLTSVLEAAKKDSFLFIAENGRHFLIPPKGINALYAGQSRVFEGRYGNLKITPYQLPLYWNQFYITSINQAQTQSEILEIFTQLDNLGRKRIARSDSTRIHFLKALGYLKLGIISPSADEKALNNFHRGIEKALQTHEFLHTLPQAEQELIAPKLHEITASCLRRYNNGIIASGQHLPKITSEKFQKSDVFFQSSLHDSSIAEQNLSGLHEIHDLLVSHLNILNRARKLNLQVAFIFSNFPLYNDAERLLREKRLFSDLVFEIRGRITEYRRQFLTQYQPFDLFGELISSVVN